MVSKRWRNCGFTLIELLVVIAIIAILAALFVPLVDRRAQQQSSGSISSAPKEFPVMTPPKFGFLAWIIRDRMTEGVTYEARVNVSPEAPTEGPSRSVKVSEKMKVTLSCIEDGAFRIQPVGGAEEQVLEDGKAEWRWDLQPLKPGRFELRLTALRILATSATGPGTKTEVSDSIPVTVLVAKKSPAELGQPLLEKVREGLLVAAAGGIVLLIVGQWKKVVAYFQGLYEMWKRKREEEALQEEEMHRRIAENDEAERVAALEEDADEGDKA